MRPSRTNHFRRRGRAAFRPAIEQLGRRDMLAPLVGVREVESNDTAATSQMLPGTAGYRVAGRVATVVDADSYSFTAAEGVRVAIDARPVRWAGRAAGVFAPRLTVYAPDGSTVATALTEGVGRGRGADYAFFAARGGVYRVVVTGRQQDPGIGRLTGGYTLRVAKTAPAAIPRDVAPVEADVLTRLALYQPASATPSVDDWKPVVAGDARLRGKNIYVAVHGWATDYAGVPAVNGTASDPLKWWQTIDYQSLTPATNPITGQPVKLTEPVAAYMFLGQEGENAGKTPISPAGLAWQLKQSDPNAAVLAYSWIDDSATTMPGPSESRTTLNGARLATALEQILPTAGDAPHGLHLLGHSHGSKVATVAATLLRQKGTTVNQLTIFDSPEQGSSVTNYNATNNLWYFLSALSIDRGQAAGTTFVDNYISDLDRRLGQIQGYDPFANSVIQVSTLQQIADVTLDAKPLLPAHPSPLDAFAHRYAPAWYSGGSSGWTANPAPIVANQWSPLVDNTSVVKPVAGNSTQSWQVPTDPQFALAAGQSPNAAIYDPRPTPLNLQPVAAPFKPRPPYDGTVALAGNGQGQTVTKAYTFKTPSLTQSDSFGVSFNLQFTAIEADDQLQITVDTGGDLTQQQVFVMTAKQLGTGQGLATLSLGSLAQHPGLLNTKRIEFSLVPSAGSQCRTAVTITNIKQFIVPGPASA